MIIIVDEQEHATILAALRYYQERGLGEPVNRSDAIHDIATNGQSVISLNAEDIDTLCERLNCSNKPLALWTMTADDESGLSTTVHLNEAAAWTDCVEQWKLGDVEGANHSKVDRLLDEAVVENEYEELRDYLEDNVGAGSLDTFQVSFHEIKISHRRTMADVNETQLADSLRGEGGAFVQAWVWVSNEEAGIPG